MDFERLYEIANHITKHYGNSNPFELCQRMGINVRYADLGTLKGMYKYIKRNYFIVISNRISEREKYVVCCHELCHHLLHRNVSQKALIWDGMLFDKGTVMEQEANILCAEILISDEELFSLAKDGNSIDMIASILETKCELVKLKGHSMKQRGFDIKGDFFVNPDFLN